MSTVVVVAAAPPADRLLDGVHPGHLHALRALKARERAAAKTALSFGNFPLRLSRACLGKMIVLLPKVERRTELCACIVPEGIAQLHRASRARRRGI